MRILTLITARGGSKRLPGKNVRPLGGRPLIVWSIEVAKGLPDIIDILVSTDDRTIADIARSSGALVPWLRPAFLAIDTASSVDVCLHAMAWYESEHGEIDGLLLLQPTSPFRSRALIERGIELFRLHEHRPVVAVCPAKSHPMSCFRIDGGTMVPFIDGVSLQHRSQDLPQAVVVSGALYLINPAQLRRSRSFYAADVVPLMSEAPEECLDIDTEWDWAMADKFLATRSAEP